jgi:hypothetical protein
MCRSLLFCSTLHRAVDEYQIGIAAESASAAASKRRGYAHKQRTGCAKRMLGRRLEVFYPASTHSKKGEAMSGRWYAGTVREVKASKASGESRQCAI